MLAARFVLWLSGVLDRHAARTHRRAYRLRALYSRLHMRAILRGTRPALDLVMLVAILLGPPVLSVLFWFF